MNRCSHHLATPKNQKSSSRSTAFGEHVVPDGIWNRGTSRYSEVPRTHWEWTYVASSEKSCFDFARGEESRSTVWLCFWFIHEVTAKKLKSSFNVTFTRANRTIKARIDAMTFENIQPYFNALQIIRDSSPEIVSEPGRIVVCDESPLHQQTEKVTIVWLLFCYLAYYFRESCLKRFSRQLKE